MNYFDISRFSDVSMNNDDMSSLQQPDIMQFQSRLKRQCLQTAKKFTSTPMEKAPYKKKQFSFTIELADKTWTPVQNKKLKLRNTSYMINTAESNDLTLQLIHIPDFTSLISNFESSTILSLIQSKDLSINPNQEEYSSEISIRHLPETSENTRDGIITDLSISEPMEKNLAFMTPPIFGETFTIKTKGFQNVMETEIFRPPIAPTIQDSLISSSTISTNLWNANSHQSSKSIGRKCNDGTVNDILLPKALDLAQVVCVIEPGIPNIIDPTDSDKPQTLFEKTITLNMNMTLTPKILTVDGTKPNSEIFASTKTPANYVFGSRLLCSKYNVIDKKVSKVTDGKLKTGMAKSAKIDTNVLPRKNQVIKKTKDPINFLHVGQHSKRQSPPLILKDDIKAKALEATKPKVVSKPVLNRLQINEPCTKAGKAKLTKTNSNVQRGTQVIKGIKDTKNSVYGQQPLEKRISILNNVANAKTLHVAKMPTLKPVLSRLQNETGMKTGMSKSTKINTKNVSHKNHVMEEAKVTKNSVIAQRFLKGPSLRLTKIKTVEVAIEAPSSRFQSETSIKTVMPKSTKINTKNVSHKNHVKKEAKVTKNSVIAQQPLKKPLFRQTKVKTVEVAIEAPLKPVSSRFQELLNNIDQKGFTRNKTNYAMQK